MVWGHTGIFVNSSIAEIAGALTGATVESVAPILAARQIVGITLPSKAARIVSPNTIALLAAHLAQPESINAALRRLSLRETSVLHVLWRKGPTVRVDSIAPAFADLLSKEEIRASLSRLLEFALLLPAEQGAVFVPAAVRAALLGRTEQPRPAAELLGAQRAGDLQRICAGLGIGKLPSSEKRLAAILTELSQPERVRERIAALPPLARRIFDEVSRTGGTAEPYALLQKFPELVGSKDPYAAYGRYLGDFYGANKSDDGLGLLEVLGLLFRYPPDWSTRLVVPDEVLTALLPPLRVQPGDFIEPALEPPPASLRPAGIQASPVLDVVECLQFVTDVKPVLTQRGLFPKPQRTRLSRQLSVREPAYADLIFALTLQARLLINAYPAIAVDEAQVRERLRQDDRSQRGKLYDLWLELPVWRDDLEEPYLRASDHLGYGLAQRQAAARLLAELPESGATLASLEARLRFRIPNLFARVGAGAPPTPRGVLLGVLRTLNWLGLAEPLLAPATFAGGNEPVGLRLTAMGRAVLRVERGDSDGFAPPTDHFTVQPTLELLAPPNIAPIMYRSLRQFADPGNASGMRTLELSAVSLRRGIDAGLEPSGVRRFLEEHSGAPVPSTVAALLADVQAKYGRIHVGQAGYYVTADDEHLLTELEADRRLVGLFIRRIAPTVALVRGEGLQPILERLRTAGHMPVADDNAQPPTLHEVSWAGGATMPRHVALNGAPGLHIVRSNQQPQDDVEPETLGDALAASAAAASPREAYPLEHGVQHSGLAAQVLPERSRRAVTDPLQIITLLEDGLDRGGWIDLKYRLRSQGIDSIVHRIIEVHDIDAEAVTAFSYHHNTERRFKLARILSAKFVDEPVE